MARKKGPRPPPDPEEAFLWARLVTRPDADVRGLLRAFWAAPTAAAAHVLADALADAGEPLLEAKVRALAEQLAAEERTS